MNCRQCNAPLVPGAHFCPKCGTAIHRASQESDSPSPPPLSPLETTQRFEPHPLQQTSPFQPSSPGPQEHTQPPTSAGQAPWAATQPVPQSPQSPHDPLSPSPLPSPLSYYQANKIQTGANMFPATINANPNSAPGATRRRSRGGCFLGCLTAIVMLLLLLVAGWVFAARPYIHNIVQSQLDTAMSSAVQQIPAEAAQLAPGSTIAVQENTLTNLIVLNLAPSNPVKQPATRITPSGVRLEFQVYGTPNAITGVPKVVNGQLVMTNTTVEGLVGLIMSPDEITALLNKHFMEAQGRLKHTIKSVQLKDQEMDLVLN